MQKQTSIYIPQPCHEDWNKMTLTQQGKFCSACNKQVVDFSLMSDNQILNFLSNQPGKLCGRFDAEQLQRPLVETKIKKKKSWWMALTMPLLFLFDKSEAQQVYINDDSIINVKATKNSLLRIVNDLEYYPTKDISIKGKVIDENNQPVPFATITEKGKKNAVAANADGYFSIVIEKNNSEVTLTVSAVGLETTDQEINFSQDSTMIVMMRMNNVLAGDVVVTVGRMRACSRVKTIDTIQSTAKKLFGTAMFKFYPNPVVNNGIINLKIKNLGNYQMQLLNNQSQLIQTDEIKIDSKDATTQIQLQSNIASGIYYLRLINEQTKRSYTGKLIVQ
jgi:carboxypeptidase-like protein